MTGELYYTSKRRVSKWGWREMILGDVAIIYCSHDEREELQNQISKSQWHFRNNWNSSKKFEIRRVPRGVTIRRVR